MQLPQAKPMSVKTLNCSRAKRKNTVWKGNMRHCGNLPVNTSMNHQQSTCFFDNTTLQERILKFAKGYMQITGTWKSPPKSSQYNIVCSFYFSIWVFQTSFEQNKTHTHTYMTWKSPRKNVWGSWGFPWPFPFEGWCGCAERLTGCQLFGLSHDIPTEPRNKPLLSIKSWLVHRDPLLMFNILPIKLVSIILYITRPTRFFFFVAQLNTTSRLFTDCFLW